MVFSLGRSKPSPYPLLPFHLLRTLQLLSALITASILIYFVWHLRDEHYPVPWTFIFLLTASLVTLPLFVLTHHLHHTTPHTSPKRLFSLNLPLALLWLLGLALLTWNLSYTLGHRCTVAQWRNNAGIMVCRMYKALTSFAVTGAAATVGATILDWRTWRGQGAGRGGYGMMRLPGEGARSAANKHGGGGTTLDDTKTKTKSHFWSGRGAHSTGSTPPPPEDGFRAATTTVSPEQQAGLRGGALWDGEQRGLTRPWKAMRTLEAKDFGYSVPEGQTTYDGERGPSMDICDR